MDEILTIKEVATYLKVSRTTVWRWCYEGKLPAFRVGRGWRIHRAAVEQLIGQYSEEKRYVEKMYLTGEGDSLQEGDFDEEMDL